MHIDDYIPDDDDLGINDIDHSDFSSILPDDGEFDFSNDDDSFLDEVMDEYHQKSNHMTFVGRDRLPSNANSDGYIPNGHKELTSTVSEIHKTFDLYSKDGHDYVLYNGKYYSIDGIGTVTIGGIKYDKIR